MNYTIEKDKAYTIVIKKMTVNCETSNEDCPKLWDDYLKKGYQNDVPPMLAVCLPNQKDDGTFIYGIGSIKECVKKIPEGFVSVEVPKQTYVKFTSKGKQPEAIQKLWKQIFTEWLPNSKYELVEAAEFECYSEGDIHSPDYEFGIWLPVKLKNC